MSKGDKQKPAEQPADQQMQTGQQAEASQPGAGKAEVQKGREDAGSGFDPHAVPVPPGGATFELLANGKLKRVDNTPAARSQIIEAIRQLDPDNRQAWVGDGRPAVTALEYVLGYDITEAARDDAWREFQSSDNSRGE